MPTVDELSTRFDFKVNRRGINEFNSAISGMKRTVLSLGAILGTGLGVAGVVRLATDLDRARFQATRFSETLRTTGKFSDELEEQLEFLQRRFGGFRPEQTFAAFAEFGKIARGFPNLQDKFGAFFEFAVQANQAGQFGDVGMVFQQIVDAIKSGDPSFLRELALVSDIDTQGLAFISKQIESGVLFSSQARPLIVEKFLEAMQGVQRSLRGDALASLGTNTNKIADIQNKLTEAAQRLADTLLTKLQPALDVITEILDLINGAPSEFPLLISIGKALGLIPEDAVSAKHAIDQLFRSLKILGIGAAAGIGLGLLLGLPPILGAAIGIAGGAAFIKLESLAEDFSLKDFLNDNVINGLGDLVPSLEDFGDNEVLEGKRMPTMMNIPNIFNFNITGDNPEAIAQEVKKVVKDLLAGAALEFTPIEGIS